MTKNKTKELYLFKQGEIGRHGLWALSHIEDGKLHRLGNWTSPHAEHAKGHVESKGMLTRVNRVMKARGYEDYKVILVDDILEHPKLKKYVVEKKEFKPVAKNEEIDDE